PIAETSAGAVVAESVERRTGAKGNTHKQSTHWTLSQVRVSQALARIRQLVPSHTRGRSRNAAIEAIAKGSDRILLVMATGTGKTYTAFQILWRLWKAGRKKRILFLADRNVLIDQTMVN